MPIRKVSRRQLELLVEFAETNSDVALGRLPSGPLGVRRARESWEKVALSLNSLAEGATKTSTQWKRYWIEYKNRTKTKAADGRRQFHKTGGGPSRFVPLSDLEERVIALIGQVAIEGMSGVRLPINIPSPPLLSSAAPEPLYASFEPPAQPDPLVLPEAPLSPVHLSAAGEMEEEWLESFASSPFPMIETGTPNHHTPGIARPQRRSRAIRQSRRVERAPLWAQNMEMRRIAVEERQAAATEQISLTLQKMCEVLKKIGDDFHSYVHRS